MDLDKVGQRYGDFVVRRVVPIEEIQCTLIEVEHEPTGAQIMQIANEDEENLFNLSFQTRPTSSNGVAHILEHTVLCGSEHYPVRDPFFSMNRRSLNTFMNALTGADFTCYPAASQVPKDFYNLLEVYLDAVFHPKLTKSSFLQEGHRLAFADPEDPNTPLSFKGIVFNEMKGAMATGDARLSEALMHALFPDLTYGVNSGGEPKQIPNLTYEELKAFHAEYYHPSRCLFFFYGNLPLQKHLDFLEKRALKGVEKLSALPPIPLQPRFKEPVVKNLGYPIPKHEDGKEKTLVGMGWLTTTVDNQEELLALNVLDLVLMGTDASPLKLALLQSNLCKQVDSYLENDMSEAPFILVCKGCKEGTEEELERIVRQTLETVSFSPLPPNLVDGAIHQLEMSRAEITGNSSPYGLSLFFRSALLKQQGIPPEKGLSIHTLFHKLCEKIADPAYLPNLIKTTFLENPHFARIALVPDQELEKKEVEEEKTQLVDLCQKLDDKGIQNLLEEAKELAFEQVEKENEDLDVLPKVHLDDVPTHGKEFPLCERDAAPFHLYYHPCFTNGLVYTDLVYDLPFVEEKDLPLLRLFTLFLSQVGCGGRTYQETLDYQLEHTGGVGASLDLFLQAENPSHMRPALVIRAKALDRKEEKLLPLLFDLLTSADFTDIPRLQELFMQHLSGVEASLQSHPLRYAVNLAAKGFSLPSKILNAWYGLDYYWTLKALAARLEADPQFFVEKFQQFQKTCLQQEHPHLIISGSESTVDELEKSDFFGLLEVPTQKQREWSFDSPLSPSPSQGRLTASPVAFTTHLFPSLSYLHPSAAALGIASEIMENRILHARIREQGGAYGAGAVHGSLSGQFYFYSYRDPQLASTLQAFKEGVETVANGEISEQDLEEAKLGLFQDLDSPTPPGSRAFTAYSRLRGGRTPEIRQQYRENLFSYGKKEVKEAAQNHLLPNFEKGVTVSFAGKELLEKENTKLPSPLPLYPLENQND
ncbi:MAG: hypothetical protein K940chlam9_00648 [Chlamydiae bacterium]|nr:hypothetical protein [Chlamydiota bacterium]